MHPVNNVTKIMHVAATVDLGTSFNMIDLLTDLRIAK